MFQREGAAGGGGVPERLLPHAPRGQDEASSFRASLFFSSLLTVVLPLSSSFFLWDTETHRHTDTMCRRSDGKYAAYIIKKKIARERENERENKRRKRK